MEIVKWGEWDEVFFEDYIKRSGHIPFYTDEEVAAVISAIHKFNYIFSGDYHQEGCCGAPYFEDGTPFLVSKREWGDIMAKAWPKVIVKWKNNLKDVRQDDYYDYVAFAWYTDELKDIYNYPEGDK